MNGKKKWKDLLGGKGANFSFEMIRLLTSCSSVLYIKNYRKYVTFFSEIKTIWAGLDKEIKDHLKRFLGNR